MTATRREALWAGETVTERAARAKAESETARVTLAVTNMHCGACMTTVEQALLAVPGVTQARANLSARRATAVYDPARADIERLNQALAGVGYASAELTDEALFAAETRDQDFLRRLAVAGFAAANVMLLSVSVWAGVASDMDAPVKSLFHWISALIAIPSIAYAGKPFFSSAAMALRARALNMDVPISLGITLATGMSLVQSTWGTDQVYFDAAITLVFFLLIGRFLDERMRVVARGAAQNLMALRSLTATVLKPDGRSERMPSRLIQPGMCVLVAKGERIPVDGIVRSGSSEVDESLITGETTPRLVGIDTPVHAGTLNLAGPVEVVSTATHDNALVAEIGRLMEAAEQGRGRYVRLADRAAQRYAPAVHILGAATFVGWMLAGGGWVNALTYAIAVLIITCPCALALAVPAVQVAAASRLFRSGIILKAPDGLERLAEADTVVFDKTGTLTLGEMRLMNGAEVPDDDLALAASLAAASRHPYARAVVAAARRRGLAVTPESGVDEVPGAGLRLATPAGEIRLGSRDFAGVPATVAGDGQLFLVRGHGAARAFRFEDRPRPDAALVVKELGRRGLAVELLSGDRPEAAARMAHTLGIGRWAGGARPDGKIRRLEEIKAAGGRVLMVGDGLNDAPALAAGHASLSPSTAVDISQTTADAIFQGERLGPVVEAVDVARQSRRLALENFAIAIAYNALFVPLAMAGKVTPLVAAVAMSTSSIIVTLNALRLKLGRPAMRAADPTGGNR